MNIPNIMSAIMVATDEGDAVALTVQQIGGNGEWAAELRGCTSARRPGRTYAVLEADVPLFDAHDRTIAAMGDTREQAIANLEAMLAA
jgi:hypothetical protein